MTDNIQLTTEDCDTLFSICLDIAFSSISEYTIRNNGAIYNGSIESCNLNATAVELGVGNHQLIFTQNATGCTDTVNVLITCYDPPCLNNNLILDEEVTIFTESCTDPGEYCVDIALEDILDYTITSNGLLYQGLLGGCDFDSIVSYSFFVLPGQGNFGPYELKSWMLNGQTYTTTFMTIPELVDSMNVWDTASTWIFNPTSLIVSGGNTQNDFGYLEIDQSSTGASATIEVNSSLEPQATELYLGQGVNELVFTNDFTGCVDTVSVMVTCLGPDILVDTIFVNTVDTMCIPTDELIGNVVSYENFCEDSSGEYVIFNQVDGTWCVQYEGVEIGIDSSCIVLCDDLGICDTTYLYVTVIENMPTDTLPVAVPDSVTLQFNSSTIVEIMNNDSINGTFDTVYILNQPTFGNATMNPDGTITYTPNNDYCDTAVPDELEYVLCNTFGCDTTTVSFFVTCADLVVYTGFSPNGDGINDVFFIEGVENFPDNELNIFNRWGNEVYFEQGYLNTWDGSWNGKLLPDGTYFYVFQYKNGQGEVCLLYTSPSPRDATLSRMPSSA